MKLLGPIDQIRKKVKKLKVGKYLKKKDVIKKLKITSEDFRKLCIYKGIYPENYKKLPAKFRGKFSKEKLCYSKEVLKKLSTEKLIHYFRKKDAVLRKYKNYRLRLGNTAEGKKIVRTFPKLVLDSIIKKRYPNLSSAIDHLTDAISTISVYSYLSPSIVGGINAHLILECKQLIDHFHYYIYKTQKLTKAFIAVDRFYLQANILDKDVTWILPGGPSFSTWSDIESNIKNITEFVEYYINLVKYVLFKLYKIENMKYPPIADEYMKSENMRHLAYDMDFVQSVNKAKEIEKKMSSDKKKGHQYKNSSSELKEKKKMTEINVTSDESVCKEKKITTHENFNDINKNDINKNDINKNDINKNDINNDINKNDINKNDINNDINNNDINNINNNNNDDSNNDDSNNKTEEKEDSINKRKKLFQGQIFFIYYNQPVIVLSLIILSCGGKIALDNTNTPYSYENKEITYEICNSQNKLLVKRSKRNKYKRNLIHPQYVFDCLNQNELLPCDQYFYDNSIIPPHLSPFADYEKIKKARERQQTIGLQYLEHMNNKKRINKIIPEIERREDIYNLSKHFVKANTKEIQIADKESAEKIMEQEEQKEQKEQKEQRELEEQQEQKKTLLQENATKNENRKFQNHLYLKDQNGQNITSEEFKRMKMLMSKKKKRLYNKIVRKEQKEERMLEQLIENAKNIYKKEAEAARAQNEKKQQMKKDESDIEVLPLKDKRQKKKVETKESKKKGEGKRIKKETKEIEDTEKTKEQKKKKKGKEIKWKNINKKEEENLSKNKLHNRKEKKSTLINDHVKQPSKDEKKITGNQKKEIKKVKKNLKKNKTNI